MQQCLFKVMQPKIKKPSNQIQESHTITQLERSLQLIQPTKLTEVNRSKIPASLRKVLNAKNQHKNQQNKEENEVKNSMFGSLYNSTVKPQTDIKECQICRGVLKKNQLNLFYLCECQHKFNFCQSCLHYYTIYKVKQLQEVFCPEQSCNILIDTKGKFFSSLPIDIQKKYKKVHQFYSVPKDTKVKICYQQKCEGWIKLEGPQRFKCDRCKAKLCQKCLFESHQGKCQNQELNFYYKSLDYRKCKKCQMINQKLQGCNHMTCGCNHQFCYVCGAEWTDEHYMHDSQGNIVQASVAVQRAQYQNDYSMQSCCSCGSNCGAIAKIFFKAFLILLGLPIIFIAFVVRDIFVFIGIFIGTIIWWLFVYPIAAMMKVKQPLLVAGMILGYPILLIVFIYGVIADTTCRWISDYCEYSSQTYSDLCKKVSS